MYDYTFCYDAHTRKLTTKDKIIFVCGDAKISTLHFNGLPDGAYTVHLH